MRGPTRTEYIDMSPDAKPDTPGPGALAGDVDLGALTQRVHAEVTRQIRAAFDELVATSQAERERAAADARKTAESQIASAVAAAEEKTRAVEANTTMAVDSAYKAGVSKGFSDGREQTLAETRDEISRAVREALAGAEQTTHMAIEAAESAARAKVFAVENSLRQQIDALERESRKDVDSLKASHRAQIEELEAASRNQLQAAEESARQRLKDVESESSQRLEVAVAAATTAARADLRSTGDAPSGERLLDAIRAIDRARSLTEI